jgi:hypothetical protein
MVATEVVVMMALMVVRAQQQAWRMRSLAVMMETLR